MPIVNRLIGDEGIPVNVQTQVQGLEEVVQLVEGLKKLVIFGVVVGVAVLVWRKK